MVNQEARARRACFTGHRPEKLTRPEAEIQHDLEQQIRQAIADGFREFISGMARGVDIWGAQIVLNLREAGADVELICACPYPGVEAGWRQSWQRQYHEILSAARVTYICDRYSRSCFQARNEWMVERSARIIAVFNGEKSGTKNTIDYAKKLGLHVVRIDG